MRTLTAFVVLGLLAAPPSLSAQSADFAIPAHVSRVDGRALIERAGDTPALAERGGDPIERNLTLTEGDRIRTFEGRVEILFADGTLLHLDRHTTVDFQTEDFVRVMEGRARWIVARGARDAVRVDTPAATLELEPGGDYRVAVAPNGDAELAVLRGSGALLNDQGDTSLRAGERAVAAVGRAPSQAFYANAASWDDFDRWSDAQRRAHASAISARYLPNELHPYGSVFDSYGSWRTHSEYGYVWYPVADAGWQPYSHGRWHSYPRYGWTWIGRDPWAWPTHHFGRWGFSAGVWFWIPGRSWGPAWVAWARSPGFVGWSPLGWNDHPIYRVNAYSPYSSGYPWCGWTFIRDRHFGGHVSPTQIVIGAGVNVIARSGIVPVASSPIPGRAVPRNGVASGKAIPRGGAIAQPGAAPRWPGGTGLAGIPIARERQIPRETIRSGGDQRRAPAARVPSESVRTPSEPSRTPREVTREPTEQTPAPVTGRPVRRPSGGGSEATSAPYPYSGGGVRAREREQPAAAPAPAPSSPDSGSRARVRESRPSAAPSDEPAPRVSGAARSRAPERASESPRSSEPPRASEPPRSSNPPRAAERPPAPAWRAPASSAPERRSAPSARPAPAPPSGGGSSGGSSGGNVRRAPSNSSGQAQSRRRGGN